MDIKILEIRDSGTRIDVLAVDMNPDPPTSYIADTQRYYLRRAGYLCDGRPNIAITQIGMDGRPAWNDPYGWGYGSRTMRTAHAYIIEHWEELRTGAVVDVEYILGERDTPKVSERFSTID